jgi:hypothetical protein
MGNSIINVVDANNPGKNRRSVDLLPSVFRTDKNTKFLAGTLDQLIQPAKIEKVSGWVGSKNTPTYNPATDFYIPEELPFRKKYQLEPGVIVRDDQQNITKAFSYDDLLNQLAFDGARTNDLNRLLAPEFYSYDPHIDWDKFVNFDQYYWVPQGPDSITITGVAKKTISTFTVTDDATGNYFIMTPDGLTPNPMLTLYRGVRYIFNINSKHKFWLKTKRSEGSADAFNDTVIGNGAATGQIILDIDDDTPKKLFYVADDTTIAGGEIIVKALSENTIINIEKEVLGKQTYTSNNGVVFTNGMKVRFSGEVIPEKYSTSEYIVEGVGTAIKLIDINDLQTPEIYTDYLDDDFDASPFDKYPFDNFLTLPITPEYITISRTSQDRNPWSRYNRWVNADVLIATAAANGRAVELPQEYRAKRPIIEFKPNIQLANFGSQSRVNVDHIDTVTTDAFSNAEGQAGYYVDQVLIEQGDRVIFAADEDPLVRDKIYQAEFLNNDGTFRLHFAEVEDSQAYDHDSVVVTKGVTNAGTSWWLDLSSGTAVWTRAQQKTRLNQAPLFDVFDSNGNSYTNKTYYNSDFVGTRMFGYSVGTGASDPVLGFPLEYKNVADQGYYLFSNYFMTDSFTNVVDEVSTSVNVNVGFLKVNGSTPKFVNVWTDAKPYTIPVIQYQVIEATTKNLEITAVKNPGFQPVTVEVFVNDTKLKNKTDYTVLANRSRLFVSFTNDLVENDRVLLKLFTTAQITDTGYYETSLGYTNNPLNGSNGQFTLSELTDHAKSSADRHPEFTGSFFGKNNIRDLSDFNEYGTRLICNKNPLSFASYFVCDGEHDVIKALRKASNQYNQFKLNLIRNAAQLTRTYTPSDALDVVLHNINLTRDGQYPFAKSDMLAFGPNVITRIYTITNPRNKEYTIPNGVFDLSNLSLRSVLVYHTDVTTGEIRQLIHERDYTFDPYVGLVLLKIELTRNDTITVKDYSSTDGCFVPLTPTKLGLYPKFEPKIFVDDTYANGPQTVIQGHDGSITLAYGDFRDQILLEYETRVFNNLKTNYNPELFDINTVMPGAFRKNPYAYAEISGILEKEFLKWAGFYGFDYKTNDHLNVDIPKTWNWKSAKNSVTNRPIPGNWRGAFKFYYDTDRPHTHPWEMLGFPIEPAWWQDVYGPAPYTSGNLVLWQDLSEGKIADPAGESFNTLYARPGLLNMIPVNEVGELLDPASAQLALGVSPIRVSDDWSFGDVGPVEAAWRRSSVWPYAVQILLAVTRPSSYFSLMFDPSRMTTSLAGQWIYKDTGTFLNPTHLTIYGDTIDSTTVMAAGYSALLVEIGRQSTKNYVSSMKKELSSMNLQLLHKAGGFVSKDKLEIIIDSVNPSTANPGVALNNEDYEIFLNQGSPIAVASISGLIIQRTSDGFVLKGYDKTYPYFTIYRPMYSATDSTITVGGKTEPYVDWKASDTEIDRENSGTAVNVTGAKFYQAGQYVSYNNGWYRVKTSHTSGSTFNSAYFTQVPRLPVTGGMSVIKPRSFESTETLIPYGTSFATEQEVYDVIMGYAKWLDAQGFIFDEYQQDLAQILDWNYAAKEFLYWTTQGWAANSVITISPFANKLSFRNQNGVVDNILNRFYEYSLLKADGTILPSNQISLQRLDNDFVIKTVNTNEGIYFAQLNIVQKEHNLIFNNASYFNDVIYDIESGYRQRRIKLKGFRTAEWSGSLNSPGFIYDEAKISDWTEYTDYTAGDIVRFNGSYYGAVKNLDGAATFDFTDWQVLGSKPTPELLPNFDFKINQFEDFYSLDIDNFDLGQQKLAQHLIGYSPRTYLDNIFTDQTTQYKFYQGFIKEKGTRNTINRLDKASLASLQTSIDFNEEWAFRTGVFGSYTTDQTIEFELDEQGFKENPQIINFVDQRPNNANDFIIYKTESDLLINPEEYTNTPFVTINKDSFDVNKILPTAGYVRLDDITATVYSKASLVDIANNRALNDGDTLWLGFREDGEWDVYRYTLMSQRVTDVVLNVPGLEATVTTSAAHRLSVGDLISISQLGSEINGVYLVNSIEDFNKFKISTTLTSLTKPFVPSVGLLFKFNSARHASLSDLSNNTLLGKYRIGEKVWVDDSGDGTWAVYEKTDAYSNTSLTNTDPGITLTANQKFGSKVVVNDNIVMVGSPAYKSSLYSGGQVAVYKKLGDDLTKVMTVQSSVTGDSVLFGTSIVSKYNKATDTLDLIVGAPGANSGRGFVKIVRMNLTAKTTTVLAETILEPSAGVNHNFGSDLFLGTDGKLWITAPGAEKVYYIADYNTSLTVVEQTGQSGTSFGYSISGSSTGSVIAIGAPSINSAFVLRNSVWHTLSSSLAGLDRLVKTGDGFGHTVAVNSDGSYVFVSAVNSDKVYVLKWNGNAYVYVQAIESPNPDQDLQFGLDMAVIDDVLVISSGGEGIDRSLTFDKYSDLLSGYVKDSNSKERASPTTFDGKTTGFYTVSQQSGSVYVYNRFDSKYVFAQTLDVDQTTDNTVYGSSVAVGNGCVVVGAPGITASGASQTGKVYVFNSTGNTWRVSRSQEKVVDTRLVNRVFTLDSELEQVVDYLEIIDPVKGRIPGLADQELKYKTIYDPAVYSIGITGTVNNTNANWLDEHVGELWWDLSAVKYVEYEQGDLEFRRNNWGRLFPGCSIDVYEWVRSKYLPSQWSALADTNEGLASGISGQPKYPDNSVLSIKQVFNPVSNNFTNVYYFWVKNKITIPDVDSRRTTALEVANLIADPKSQGVKYASVIANNALMVTNLKTGLSDKKIHLSIDLDSVETDINKHTEWIILRENDRASTLDLSSPLLTKLVDSLLGRDSLGNTVPDPKLPARLKYGVGFRPRQSMFKDRVGALRNVVEYVNTVFSQYIVNEETYDFSKLYATEQPDDPSDGHYDTSVLDNIERDTVSSRYWRQAKLGVTLKNGRIESVSIIDAGFGYGNLVSVETDVFGNPTRWKGPSVSILGDGSGAEIQTTVDANGAITTVMVKAKGKNYTYITPIVRPHSAIVRIDDTVNNRWSLYEWDYTAKDWTRVRTQSYDVTKYWKYVDWATPDYVHNRTITKTLQYTYQLAIINVPAGSYVRINNPGDGKYIILRKLDATKQPGTFNTEYDIVFKEKGTIQLLDSVWNIAETNYGFDSTASFDQTPFSQSNEKEVELIIKALLVDILNNELQIYNNKLWFKLIRYAFTEQKFLDWAFKTSFIYVQHNAGALDQRPTYKLQNTSYYESYISETKPYHTEIRSFQSNYTATELSTVYPTDFDMPSYYNTSTKQFDVVSFGNPLMLQQPYKNWFTNYTFTVSNILVYDGGSGYRTAPEVKVTPAAGDPGYGATAKAYIALGQVTAIEITDPGQGYLTSPTIELVGGGRTDLVPARAVARIANGKVRSNKIQIKFDRVSGYNEVGDKVTLDTFIGDGSTREWKLTWFPDTNIFDFTVKSNGILVLPNTYSLIEYTEPFDGYTKKYAKLVLGTVPKVNDVITVAYNKNISLYHAVDRIRDYYKPVAGMPGNTATMLMSGLEYPGVTVDTLPFRSSAGFDTVGWATNTWDDYDIAEGFYSTTGTGVQTVYTLPYTPALNQKVNVYLTTSTNTKVYTQRVTATSVTTSGVLPIVNGVIIGDGFTSRVDIGTTQTTTATIIDFRLQDSDGAAVPSDLDIDVFINSDIKTAGWGADPYLNRISSINIDGDGFVTPENSYGPEENLPGRVSDTLGISVYTRPATSAPTVTSRRYIIDGTVLDFDMGVKPANSSSVQVVLGNTQLTQGIDYTLDFVNNQIHLFTATAIVNTSTAVQGPYFTTTVINPRREGKFGSVPVNFNQDDDFNGPFDLGFRWNMFGQYYNQVYIGTNGYLTFGGGSALYTPVQVGVLPYPAIYAEYTDLWQGYGTSGQQLSTGETPGIFYATGTVGNFKYFRMRFQGSHYIQRNQTPTIPAYDYECTLYTDGTNQYVETIYEIIPSTVVGLGANDIGAVFGIANAGSVGAPGSGVIVSPQSVQNNTSHVFYSTNDGGDWKYAGKGSFDPFRIQNAIGTVSTSTPGALSITTLGVGGVGLLEQAVVTVTPRLLSFNEFSFSSAFADVNSEYITVNGVKVTNYTLSADNDRGRVLVTFDQDLELEDVIQVWFFNSNYKEFNEVTEQIFANLSSNDTTFTLANPPGVTAPYHNQAIVTWNGRRLLPPDIVYYVATGNRKTYPVTHGVNYDSVTSGELEVYVNGSKKLSGKDYIFKESDLTITFKKGKVVDGDALAFVILKDHEYEIQGTELSITGAVEITGNDTLIVTTYNNHDGLSMRKERFTGTYNGRYVLSRTVYSSNYVWVEINGRPVVAEVDYTLDNDKQTVRLAKRLTDADTVVITTLETGNYDLLGFRIFYDNYGRTHYKRLSGQNTTELVANLLPDDDSITVFDSDVLTPPDIEKRIPGVIVIDGERIEFYKMENNRLSQLKRGALGTGVKALHPAGTLVVDQGINQTIRIKDTVNVEKLPTSTSTDISSVAIITSSTQVVSFAPLVTQVTGTIYTTTFVQSIPRSGNSLTYQNSPSLAPSYRTLQVFDSSKNTIVGHIPQQTEVAWIVMSEVSNGSIPGLNKQWFDNLQTAVNNSADGINYLTVATTSGSVVYTVKDIYRGDLLSNRSRAFSARYVNDPITGSTSTAWYLNVALVSGTGTFEAGTSARLSWEQIGQLEQVNVPHTVINTVIIKDGTTITTTTYTTTQINSSGTIFELNDIDFVGIDTDVSRQVDVYYQGTKLKHSNFDIERKVDNIAYDSNEVNSVGQSSTELVPNEYSVRQYGDRYFLEVFVPVEIGSELKVVRNKTDVWYDINSNKSLVDQNTEQIRFLRSSPARLPDKYLYGQNTDSIPVLVTEFGDTLDSESGDPLLGE